MEKFVALLSSAPFWLYALLFAGLGALLTVFAVLLRTAARKDTGHARKKVRAVQEPESELDRLLKPFGYAFDEEQGIAYSRTDAWQRKYGYCRAYDEAMAPLGIIADCEPVVFSAGGKQYLIELWKGQYGATAGGEIGVYIATGDKLAGGEWYRCADDSELLDMSMTVYRIGSPMFQRSGRHWWLTGFVPGEFTESAALSLQAVITFPVIEEANAFLRALRELGYSASEAYRRGMAVTVWMTRPKSKQPITRTELVERLAQERNRAASEALSEIAGRHERMVELLKRRSFGRPAELFMGPGGLRTHNK